MNPLHLTFLSILLLAGCGRQGSQPQETAPGPVGSQPAKAASLAEARQGFKTKLTRQESAQEPVPEPPAKVFRKVQFDAPVGKLAAYITPDPRRGGRWPGGYR